jgi:hypothetical protein
MQDDKWRRKPNQPRFRHPKGHLFYETEKRKARKKSWEVTLHFRDVRIEETHALIPAPPNGPAVAVPRAIPQSA